MNKVILFSPVGGTDPISLTNCRDGSLLHICRTYKPDIVYMYMSKEILENQEKDDRYRYCLDRLAELNSHKMEYRIIERRDLCDVQNFDYFYRDFREIIVNIFKEMDDTDKLIVNISSGTPAMKSGLLVLATIGEFPCVTVQVITPEKKMNEHIHRGYDVQTLWELNEDNDDSFINRCAEVKCPTLSQIKQEEIIKMHLYAYDYSAAVAVAKTLKPEAVEKYIELLEMAEARLLLDYSKAEKIAKKQGIDIMPVKSGDARKYFEYAVNLEIKLKRKEYVDFIRGITPLIADILELIIKNKIGLSVDDYTFRLHGVRKWDESKLKGTKILAAMTKEYKDFRYGDIKSDNLLAIINELSDDSDMKILVQSLRQVEREIRNTAAHEIVSVTEDTIKRKTGLSSREIMEKIKRALIYGGIKIKSEYWNTYDEMNRIIIGRMQ